MQVRRSAEATSGSTEVEANFMQVNGWISGKVEKERLTHRGQVMGGGSLEGNGGDLCQRRELGISSEEIGVSQNRV